MIKEERTEQLLAIIEAAVNKAASYLNSDFGLKALAATQKTLSLDEINLKGFTSVIGIAGNVDVYIAFCFQEDLLDFIYKKMTQGIVVTAQEEASLKESVANEVINIVVGHATIEFQKLEEGLVNITPPNLINLIKTVPRLKDAIFLKKTLITQVGELDILTIAPRELFTIQLDYKE